MKLVPYRLKSQYKNHGLTSKPLLSFAAHQPVKDMLSSITN